MIEKKDMFCTCKPEALANWKPKKVVWVLRDLYLSLHHLSWDNQYLWRWKVVLKFRFTKLLCKLKPLDSRHLRDQVDMSDSGKVFSIYRFFFKDSQLQESLVSVLSGYFFIIIIIIIIIAFKKLKNVALISK